MVKEINFSSQAINDICRVEFFKNCGEIYPRKDYILTKTHAEKFALSSVWRDYREE